jgi:cell division septation protein DedD
VSSRNDDTEITLGTGRMLALFFGLVVLCAIFFGMGFSMGKGSARSAPEPLASPGAANVPRPSASPTKTPEAPAPQLRPLEHSTTAQNQAPSQAAPDSAAAPPPEPGTGYFVQVAAVSKREDAEALVESLDGRQYKAFIADPSPDKLFHVQIGPYADIKDAEATRTKLVSDGYSPILKK